MEERVVQFMPFLASRANEIAQLQNNLKSKYLNCTAQPFQVIHKHMRRRAMSHNRYRIPSQLRKKMYLPGLIEKELQQRVPRCRKHIRKNKTLIFLNRSNKILWMETHLYQVKRMKMINYYGFKVAEKANEKNFRAVHRYFDHGSMIFDASYYQIAEGIIEEGLVVENQTIIHPQDVPDTDLVIHNNKYNIFQIIGRESLQTINQLLSNFDCQIDGQNAKYFQFEYVYTKLQSTNQSKGRKIKTFDDYKDDMQDMDQIYENKGDEDLEKSVWLIDQQYFQKRFKIDTRVRYTHSKTKKLIYQRDQMLKKQAEKGNKEINPEIKDQIPVDQMKKKKAMRWLLNQFEKNEGEVSMDIEENAVEDQQIDEQLKESQIEQEKQPKTCPTPKKVHIKMLIIPPSKQLKQQIDIGFKLIINMGAGLIIWRLFNQLKVKPIGLRDIRQICLENSLSFHDYESPDLFDEYLRSTTKINYLALQFPYPFSFNFSLYPTWKECYLKAYKNVPEKLALIFRPLDSDFELLKKGIHKIKVIRTVDEKPLIKNRLELLQYEKQLSHIQLERKILGQVQFGNISLQYGKGLGCGKIDGKLTGKEIIVLFRNRNSEYYFFADCTIN